jgi:hypothetical protein
VPGIAIVLKHCKFFMIGFDKVKEVKVKDKLILFLVIFYLKKVQIYLMCENKI